MVFRHGASYRGDAGVAILCEVKRFHGRHQHRVARVRLAVPELVKCEPTVQAAWIDDFQSILVHVQLDGHVLGVDAVVAVDQGVQDGFADGFHRVLRLVDAFAGLGIDFCSRAHVAAHEVQGFCQHLRKGSLKTLGVGEAIARGIHRSFVRAGNAGGGNAEAGVKRLRDQAEE